MWYLPVITETQTQVYTEYNTTDSIPLVADSGNSCQIYFIKSNKIITLWIKCWKGSDAFREGNCFIMGWALIGKSLFY